MLRAITWTEFLSFLMIVTIVYYSAIFLFYYKRHLQLLRALINRIGGGKRATAEEEPVDPDNLFQQASVLSSSLNSIMQEASDREILHSELKQALASELKKYRNLKNTGFQVAINNLIQKECIAQCSVTLSDDELNMLWNG